MSKDICDRHGQAREEIRRAAEGNHKLSEAIGKERNRQKTAATLNRTLDVDVMASPNKKQRWKKDLELMMKTSALDATVDHFHLPERNKINFAVCCFAFSLFRILNYVLQAAVQAQLSSLLNVPNLTRRYICEFPNAESNLVEAFTKSPDAIDFTKSKQYCYSFMLDFNHPLNAAARSAFYKHFKLTIHETNWLDKYPFDHRLMLDEVIAEVLEEKLMRAKKLWDKCLVFVKLTPYAKQKKRVDSRVYNVSISIRDVCFY